METEKNTQEHWHGDSFRDLYSMQNNSDPDVDKEETDNEEAGDWGHTDPSDSPFPDSNDPSGPGSAV